jgi:hypothetical protein
MIKSAAVVVPALFLVACAVDTSEESAPPEDVGETELAASYCEYTIPAGYNGCFTCYNGGDDCGGTTIMCCPSMCCSTNNCSTQCWS